MAHLLGADVHDVVRHTLERVHRRLEVRVDLLHGDGQGLALGAAHLDLGQLGELHNGLSQVEDVVAPLEERVEAHEERVVLNAPRVGRALGGGGRLVVKVRALESTADTEGRLELLDRQTRVLTLDKHEDLLTAHVLTRLVDQRVADLPHEHHQPRGRVVVLRVLPDEQNDVQHRLEELEEVREVVLLIEAAEPVLQSAQVLHVVVRLHAGREDLLAKTRERLAVGRLRLVEGAEHAADALALQLLENRVQVVSLQGEGGGG